MSKTGTVYKISSLNSEKVYVGSTTRTLNQRLSHHKSRKTCMCKELLKLGECKIEALEVLYNCTKKELILKEQHYLDLLKETVINKKRAYTTKEERSQKSRERSKQWVKNNHEKYLEKQRQYRLAKNGNTESS